MYNSIEKSSRLEAVWMASVSCGIYVLDLGGGGGKGGVHNSYANDKRAAHSVIQGSRS